MTEANNEVNVTITQGGGEKTQQLNRYCKRNNDADGNMDALYQQFAKSVGIEFYQQFYQCHVHAVLLPYIRFFH